MEQATLDKPTDAIKTNGGEGKATPAPPPPPSQVPNKRRRLLVAGILGGVLVLTFLAYEIHFAFTHESTDDAFIDAHVSAIGTRVAGQVNKVLVDDNQPVKEGDVLVEIDPRDYDVQLDQARARLLSAEAHARRTDLDLVRYRRLVRTDDATRQQLDVAKADDDSAQADVLQQQAAVKQAELDRSYAEIVAPESGRVTNKSVEVGDYLKVGQSILAIVPDKPWVTANFKETQLTHMQRGQPVTIEVDTYPGKEFDGHVDSIQAGTGAQFSLLPPENATGNYVKVVQRIPVKILIDTVDDAHPLVPGMSVVPTVKIK